jgi:hypothetical protein
MSLCLLFISCLIRYYALSCIHFPFFDHPLGTDDLFTVLLLFSSALQYTIRNGQEKTEELELSSGSCIC